MANVLIEQDTMADIADAIRGKNGSVSTYTPAQMITAIANIPTGGGSPNIQALSVTANGTYTATDDVDGYSPVIVNVSGGGASNLVTGTFTFSRTSAAAQSVALDYSGSGYPIACAIVLDDGVLNETYTNTIARYSIAQFFMTKTYIDETPTYAASGNQNLGAVASVYKSSSSTAATLTRTNNASAVIFNANSATAATTNCVRFNNRKSMSVYAGAPSGTTRYGFFNGLAYRYWIIYSS